MQYLFNPRSVAVIGAGSRGEDPGNIIVRNLISGGFAGPVMPVSDAPAISGVLTYKTVDDLPLVPDLAVLSLPLEQTIRSLKDLSRRGVKAAILLGSNFSGLSPAQEQAARASLRAAAGGMRIIGPHSMGVMAPHVRLNATMAHTVVLPGRVAFVSQSDSLFTTVLDWGKANGVGFSHVVSLGARQDVSFSHMLDYLSADIHTKAILLYLETILDARSFMSAARAASKIKPVLVLRPGAAIDHMLVQDAQTLPPPLSREKITPSEIYDMAFRRAGMLRVRTIDALFHAARTLSSGKTLRGERLAIVTNGTSAGVMAADALLAGQGSLAVLSEDTCAAIDSLLGQGWTGGNPVGIPYNADGGVYAELMNILSRDKGVDAILLMQVPFAGLNSLTVAQPLIPHIKKAKRLTLLSWMGAESSVAARHLFDEAGLPSYETPEQAIRAFLYLTEYQRNQAMLMQTPDPLDSVWRPDREEARAILSAALAQGRSRLSHAETASVLKAYQVPMVESIYINGDDKDLAKKVQDAVRQLGAPVSIDLDLNCDEIPQDLEHMIDYVLSPESAVKSVRRMLGDAAGILPPGAVRGLSVRRANSSTGLVELFINVGIDPTFGSVITVGHGGGAREAAMDNAAALPPLNMALARDLISRTRIAKLIKAGKPAARMQEVRRLLVTVDQLFEDLLELESLDLDPVYVDDVAVSVGMAVVRISPAQEERAATRLAIRPYPKELEEVITLEGGLELLFRPIRAEDEPSLKAFVDRQSAEDLRLRFFNAAHSFDHEDMANFTQLDYERQMAFVACVFTEGEWEIIGVVRTTTSPDNEDAEFGMMVRSDMKKMGIGRLLLEKMIRYTKSRGSKYLISETMRENTAMQVLARRVGMTVESSPDDDEAVRLVLRLN